MGHRLKSKRWGEGGYPFPSCFNHTSLTAIITGEQDEDPVSPFGNEPDDMLDNEPILQEEEEEGEELFGDNFEAYVIINILLF